MVPHVLLKHDGLLRKEFEAVAPTMVWPQQDAAAFVQKCRSENYDVIYSNTITNGALLEALAPPAGSVITHVHELGYWITHRSGALNNAQVVQHTDCYIAASQRGGGLPRRDAAASAAENISSSTNLRSPATETSDVAAARRRVREELKIPANSAGRRRFGHHGLAQIAGPFHSTGARRQGRAQGNGSAFRLGRRRRLRPGIRHVVA